MKRTTVFFDDQMMRRLQRAAQRAGVSTASLVREAVAIYLAAPATTSPLPSIAGQADAPPQTLRLPRRAG